MTHTPGPWRFYDRNPIIVIVSETRDICDVWNDPDTNGTVAQSNARLIAAAPDLLAACEWALRWADADPNISADSSYYRSIKAAIAKAKEA